MALTNVDFCAYPTVSLSLTSVIGRKASTRRSNIAVTKYNQLVYSAGTLVVLKSLDGAAAISRLFKPSEMGRSIENLNRIAIEDVGDDNNLKSDSESGKVGSNSFSIQEDSIRDLPQNLIGLSRSFDEMGVLDDNQNSVFRFSSNGFNS